MNYETTKHQGRAGNADQQSREVAQTISVESQSDRRYETGIWDIPASSISLCSRSRKAWRSFTSARREGSGDCEIAFKHEQAHSTTEEERERKYQWDYDQVVEGLPETKWYLIEIADIRNLNMNLTG